VSQQSTDRILSGEECEAINKRVLAFAKGEGDTRVAISSWWQGELRWARNRVSLAGDRRDVQVSIGRGSGSADTNQLDDVSLEAAVRAAERADIVFGSTANRALFVPPLPPIDLPKPAIWSDRTYNLTTEARGGVARSLAATAEEKGMLSAGYIEARAGSIARLSASARAGKAATWETPYVRWTHAQCSMTVRDPQGTGSGWAGLNSYDWSDIETSALAERALQKCIASQNPVALEPGRYTVILEPQALADLLRGLISWLGLRELAEDGQGPFVVGRDEALGIIRTKLGLKVADDRVTISHDLADPELGIVPRVGYGAEPAAWIDRGMLTALSFERPYALEKLNKSFGIRKLNGFRMSGGDTSVDEMIRTMKRGLLVTRFSNVDVLDPVSLLSTGLTRDGLWLIENGKISKAVKNFRFTESPLFALNSLEQLGRPVRVFRPTGTGQEITPAIVPPVKVRDFSFTSMIDAV
jgi:predicted Zn-dependent protease